MDGEELDSGEGPEVAAWLPDPPELPAGRLDGGHQESATEPQTPTPLPYRRANRKDRPRFGWILRQPALKAQLILWRLFGLVYRFAPSWLVRTSVEAFKFYPALASRYVRTSPDTAVGHLIASRLAMNSFRMAAKRVPAYREFLARRGVDPKKVRSFQDFCDQVPPTNRRNYIRAFPLRDLYVGGRLPERGAIDESAGSTGDPLSWVRSRRELRALERILQTGLDLTFARDGRRPTILINTFSCGPWAGGVRLGNWTEDWCLVKNDGPDPERVGKTLQTFGPGEKYLLAGYPPSIWETVRYLRELPGLDLKAYRIDVMTGGEGFPEEWRERMKEALKEGAVIASGYGASDLEIGIAGETPYSLDIMSMLREDAQLRRQFFGSDRMPAFFGQYNLGVYLVRTIPAVNGRTEVEVTILGAHTVSPRVKYCVGDEGGVIPFEKVKRLTSRAGWRTTSGEMALPFLYVFGRVDGTVSIDGANIYPQTIASALLANPETADRISTFKIGVHHPPDGPVRLTVVLRAAREVQPDRDLTNLCKETILRNLLVQNGDFRESYRANPASTDPLVQVVGYHAEPFSGDEKKIKHSYFL